MVKPRAHHFAVRTISSSPTIILATWPDLGDVSQDKLVTNMNYYDLFDGVEEKRGIAAFMLAL